MKILKSSGFKNKETEKIVKEQVSAIIEDIKINKDEALKKYNLKFDNNDRNIIRVSKEEIEEEFAVVMSCTMMLIGFMNSPDYLKINMRKKEI